MTTKKLLKVMAWLFLLAGLAGLAASVWRYAYSGSFADYGVMAIGGTFWLFCSAVSFYLGARLG